MWNITIVKEILINDFFFLSLISEIVPNIWNDPAGFLTCYKGCGYDVERLT